MPMEGVSPLNPPAWKSLLNWTAAILIAIIFLVAGLWKVTDPTGAAVRLAQAKVPENLSLFTAISLGIAETLAGVMLLIPKFRRWGAWLGCALLVAFMGFIAIHYNELRGAECSCFPWVKRAVGPGFFVADSLMLLCAIVAGLWVRRSEGLRNAVLILCALSVFAGVSYGVSAARHKGVQAPATIMVDGKPYSIQEGKVFIYFFDPECMHCLDAGKRMAKLNWGVTRFVGVATTQPQFAPNFMQATALKGAVSTDLQLLKSRFPFTAPPAGVALENGYETAALTQFADDEPAATLRKLKFAN